MEHIFKKLNKLRFLRISLLVGTFIFCAIGLVLNQFLIKQEWLYAMFVFDDLILFAILFVLIESHIGTKYEAMYHNEFLPLVFKKIHTDIHYNYQPTIFDDLLINAKLFDYTSEIKINHIVDCGTYELWNALIYLRTTNSRKIIQFRGYIIKIKNKALENKGLFLYKKRPFLGTFKEIKSLNFYKYRIFSINNNEINQEFYESVKTVLLKYYNKQKFYVCIDDEAMIFKPSYFSFFKKPLLRKINKKFLDKKILKFKTLMNTIEDLIECI